MPDYSKGKVYCIRSHKTDRVYVGSTCQTLSERFADHRRDYNGHLNGRRNYRSSFEILKEGDAYIELIERVNATDKMDLLVRENHYVREMDCVNKHNPGAVLLAGSKKQYMNEYNPVYRQNNRDVLNAKQKTKHDCLCGGRYTRVHNATHKKSRLHRLYILNLHHELNHLADIN